MKYRNNPLNCRLKVLLGLALTLGVFFLTSCNDQDVRTQVVVGEKVYLKEWPDSAYLAQLDSLAGPVYDRPADSVSGVVIGMNSQIQTLNPFKQKPQVNHKAENLNEKQSEVVAAVSAHTSAMSPEVFGKKFIGSLEALRKDPNNQALKMVVQVNGETSLGALLKRVYGSKAAAVPEMMAKFSLSSLNEGVDLGALKSGEQVVLPQVK